ncbi:ribose-phosphate diphosphokinase [Candidatus Parcubacteria bacterium]|nr:ribose-phosphate diphosphokinase [Patescibacteria group bacterium]MBU4481986.1 ribose-phosphate diphosphokinase [Patescibacteria group bacterium]MCG2686524.1 ribose-phosphate diphosphokinase [Candidatus Parcubacteria bacterium]
MKKKKIESIVFFGPHCSFSLVEDVSRKLNLDSANIEFETFSDGEKWVMPKVNIRERRVIIVQPTPQPEDSWAWLSIMTDAVRRASAEKIIVISPYFGYARQDRKDKPRVAITARTKANHIEADGVDRIIIMDPHFSQIQGFFNIPCDLLYGSKVFQTNIDFSYIDTVIAGDGGAVKIAVSYINHYSQKNTNFGLIIKRREEHNKVKKTILALENEDIENHNVLIVDEMIDTAGTLVKGLEEINNRKPNKIEVAITHAILSGDAIKRINDSPLETMYVLDTVQIPAEKLLQTNKIKIIHSGYLFAKTIELLDNRGSLSSLVEN